MAEKTKGYELLAGTYHETTSKPGEPFTYKTYVQGDTIQLDAEQAERLIKAGAVKDPKAAKDSGEPGGTPKAPGGTARGVDADSDDTSDKGTIGDGGPDPQGTGSTDASGTGGGAGDGQGSAADNPGASTPTPPSRGRGSRSAS